MDLDDVWGKAKEVLFDTAPLLASAVSTVVPGGGLAVNLISKVLSCESNPMAIEQAVLGATSEQLTELKELEFTHKEKLADLAFENEKIRLQDVQSARNREVSIAKVTGKRDIMPPVLAIITVVCFFALIAALMKYQIPAENSKILYMLAGIVVSQSNSVYNYFFGSSKGSSDKTKLMNFQGGK